MQTFQFWPYALLWVALILCIVGLSARLYQMPDSKLYLVRGLIFAIGGLGAAFYHIGLIANLFALLALTWGTDERHWIARNPAAAAAVPRGRAPVAMCSRWFVPNGDIYAGPKAGSGILDSIIRICVLFPRVETVGSRGYAPVDGSIYRLGEA